MLPTTGMYSSSQMDEIQRLTSSARVHYTIGTAFHLPPKALKHLNTSIEQYKVAMTLCDSPILALDSGFNLAQSYIALAEIVEDSDLPDTQPKMLELWKEAGSVLSGVLDGQEEFLDSQAQETGDEAMEASEQEDEVEMDVDTTSAGNEGEEEASFETYLPTPSTFIDTALALVDLAISKWESADPPQAPSETDQAFVRATLDRAARKCPADRQPELDLAEIKVLLSIDGIVWDMYHSEATIGSDVGSSLEGATAVLDRLLASLDPGATPSDATDSTVRAEIITTLAETHSTIADRLTYLLPQVPVGPSPLAQRAWYHYSQSVSDLNKALELPTSASTPREFKPSVYLSLSIASLDRAQLHRVNDTAKKNAPQLIENAWTYASKAAEGLKWGLLALGNTTSFELPPPGGWDSESLGREIVLQSLRLCFVASRSDGPLGTDVPTKYASGLEGLLVKIKRLPVDRRLQAREVREYRDDLNDDHELGRGEAEWWESIAAQLEAAA
jgi:hypothetical protein